MPNYNKSKAYRVEERGRVVPSAIAIKRIQEVSINASTFTAVTIPKDVACKAVLVKTREGGNWYVSTTLLGTTYLTVNFGPLVLDIAGRPEEILLYAKSASGSKTLEIMYVD